MITIYFCGQSEYFKTVGLLAKDLMCGQCRISKATVAFSPWNKKQNVVPTIF